MGTVSDTGARPPGKSDLLVLISGGGNALSNQYSQYLQTKVLADWLRRRYKKPGQLRVFFGAGNRTPGRGYADVHAIERNGDRQIHRFLPGAIEGNTKASRSHIASFFARADVRNARGDLFLFVSDHGIAGGDFLNNCIVLWSPDNGRVPEEERCLSVKDLREMLRRMSARRIVFGMSQCYSGGFHQLSVGRDRHGFPTANTRICGFSSTNHRRIAAGCTPDVDAVRYQGYERTFTEEISATDVVSGVSISRPRPTHLRGVHRRAALRDFTIDIPLSTTEYFLLDWAALLGQSSFRVRGGPIDGSTAHQIARDVAMGRLSGEQLLRKSGALRANVRDMQQYIALLETALDKQDRGLRSKTRDQAGLERRLDELDRRLESVREKRRRDAERHAALFGQRVHPAWSRAVSDGSSGLPKAVEQGFEKPLLRAIGRAGFKDGWEQALEQYFLSRLHKKALSDPPRARRYALYFADRDQRILDWAESGNNLNLESSVQEVRNLAKRVADLQDQAWTIEQKKAMTLRVHYMRTALGAMVALGAMQDKRAIGAIRGLATCETTPLPTHGR